MRRKVMIASGLYLLLATILGIGLFASVSAWADECYWQDTCGIVYDTCCQRGCSYGDLRIEVQTGGPWYDVIYEGEPWCCQTWVFYYLQSQCPGGGPCCTKTNYHKYYGFCE